MSNAIEATSVETKFVMPEIQRPFILGGHFGQGFNDVTVDAAGHMTVSKHKRHFFLFHGKKTIYEYNINDIEKIEYKKKVHGRTKILIAIGVLGMLFTGGITGAYVFALLTCFHERNVTISLKNGGLCMLRDIANFSAVNDLVEHILQINPAVEVIKNVK